MTYPYEKIIPHEPLIDKLKNLFNTLNKYNSSQKTAIFAFIALALVIPFTGLMIKNSTDSRSRAASQYLSVPVTSPVTPPTITLTSGTRASLSCTPSTGTYNLGNTFTVDLVLDTHGNPVFGADIRASYDTSLLDFVGTPTFALTDVTKWSNPINGYIDQVKGQIIMDYGNNQPAFSGITSIGRVTFKSKKTGQALFPFTFYQQFDNTSINVSKVWGTKDGVNKINNLTDVTNCIYVTSQSSGPPPVDNKISWKTKDVSLEADNFFIHVNNKYFLGKANDLVLHSDPPDPPSTNYTTLEATWHENGVEMRLFMYFYRNQDKWWLDELRIYNGKESGDWYYNRFTENKFITNKIGNSFFAGDLGFSAVADNDNSYQAGEIHFNNINIQPFVDNQVSYPCTDSDNGKDYFRRGTTIGLSADNVMTTRIDTCWPPNSYRDGYDYVAEWFCWKNPSDGKEYAINTNEKCLNGCSEGSCLGTPSATPLFRMELVNQSQIIMVGDVFDVNILINTAGQKTLGADANIVYDSGKLNINPNQTRTGNFFDNLLTNKQPNNNLILSGWQYSENISKSTSTDRLFATLLVKAQAEGSTKMDFNCTSSSADSNIWSERQKDIILCNNLQPLIINILGRPSPTETPTISPTPTSIISITPTTYIIGLNPQNANTLNYPSPTYQIPRINSPSPTSTLLTQLITPTSYIFPTSIPTSIESVQFTRIAPTSIPKSGFNAVRNTTSFVFTLLGNIFSFLFRAH